MESFNIIINPGEQDEQLALEDEVSFNAAMELLSHYPDDAEAYVTEIS